MEPQQTTLSRENDTRPVETSFNPGQTPGIRRHVENPAKKCIHRTASGFCKKSNRRCPALIF
jgi:hypothetical protein